VGEELAGLAHEWIIGMADLYAVEVTVLEHLCYITLS